MWTEYFTANGGNMDKIKWKLFKVSNKIYILAHLEHILPWHRSRDLQCPL